MKYSMDTNSFVRAWWDRYPPGAFPGFWEEMDHLIQSGELRASFEVRLELEKQDDALVAWLVKRPEVFVEIDDAIEEAVTEILANHGRLLDTRKNRSGADPFVIALAKVHGCKVVTEEGPSTSLKRPHIPDACGALGIPCIKILDLIQECGWKFARA